MGVFVPILVTGLQLQFPKPLKVFSCLLFFSIYTNTSRLDLTLLFRFYYFIFVEKINNSIIIHDIDTRDYENNIKVFVCMK